MRGTAPPRYLAYLGGDQLERSDTSYECTRETHRGRFDRS